jgi:hypothetical protein
MAVGWGHGGARPSHGTRRGGAVGQRGDVERGGGGEGD